LEEKSPIVNVTQNDPIFVCMKKYVVWVENALYPPPPPPPPFPIVEWSIPIKFKVKEKCFG
jgi:hypothetical protein